MALLYCFLIVSSFCLFGFKSGLLSVFLESLLGITVFPLLPTTGLFSLASVVLSLSVSVQLSKSIIASTYGFVLSITGNACAGLEWLVYAWVLFSSCCDWFKNILVCLLVCPSFYPWIAGPAGTARLWWGVAFTCFLFLVISHPIIISHFLHEKSLLWSPFSMKVP